MNYREIVQFAIIVGNNVNVKDIRKDKNADPIISQLAPCRKNPFVNTIKKFRQSKRIDYQGFIKLKKAFNNGQRQHKKKLREIFGRITQEDIVNIRNEYKLSPLWDTVIKHFILTNIMPNPLRYKCLNWEPIPELTRPDRYHRDKAQLHIKIYRDTACDDIINPAPWAFLQSYKQMLYKSRKRYVTHTSLEPIFDEINKTLRIPIYADTTQEILKEAWTKHGIAELQKKLPKGQIKYAKLYKNFEEDLDVVERLRDENYEDISEEGGDIAGYNRIAQVKSRMIKRGYVKPYRKKPVQAERNLSCKGCIDYNTCKTDSRKSNTRCKDSYKRKPT